MFHECFSYLSEEINYKILKNFYFPLLYLLCFFHVPSSVCLIWCICFILKAFLNCLVILGWLFIFNSEIWKATWIFYQLVGFILGWLGSDLAILFGEPPILISIRLFTSVGQFGLLLNGHRLACQCSQSWGGSGGGEALRFLFSGYRFSPDSIFSSLSAIPGILAPSTSLVPLLQRINFSVRAQIGKGKSPGCRT